MANAEIGNVTGGYILLYKTEYEKLLRESERLAMARRYIERSEYASTDDIKIIICDERKVDGNVSE